jgi:hypothetical protein
MEILATGSATTSALVVLRAAFCRYLEAVASINTSCELVMAI